MERIVTKQAYLRVAGIYYEEENFDFYSGKVVSSLPYLQDKRAIIEEDQAIPYLKENVSSLLLLAMSQYTDIDLDFSEIDRAEIALFTHTLHTFGDLLLVFLVRFHYLQKQKLWLRASNVQKVVSSFYKPVMGSFSGYSYAFSNSWQTWKRLQRFHKAITISEKEVFIILLLLTNRSQRHQRHSISF